MKLLNASSKAKTVSELKVALEKILMRKFSTV